MRRYWKTMDNATDRTEPRGKYCRICGGHLLVFDMRQGAAETQVHYAKDTCVQHLKKRVEYLELQAMGMVEPGGILLNSEEALTLLAALHIFLSALGQAYGKGPAIVLGLLGKKAGIKAFTAARILPDYMVIDKLDSWYGKERSQAEAERVRAEELELEAEPRPISDSQSPGETQAEEAQSGEDE
jgi:hypothetical protein